MRQETTNETRLQVMYSNPTNGYYKFVTSQELHDKFTELYNFFLNVRLNNGEVYTSKLNEECTLHSLVQMNNSGLFS